MLREPNGHDQALLADLDREATPAERVTSIIAALLLRIGALEHPGREAALRITAGDRERLLLAVAAQLLGPELDLVAACPDCSSLLEVPTRLREAIDQRPREGAERIALPGPGGTWEARCRPPVGADLERAGRRGPNAVRMLVLDCIKALADPSGAPADPADLPEDRLDALADALAALDPAAEARVELTCPSCGRSIAALLDGFSLVRTALGGSLLYEEVFRMARAYHWSEKDILSLPLGRRRRYLAIADAADAGP